MAVSRVYSCDLCWTEAKSRGHIDDGWHVVYDLNSGIKGVLCGECYHAVADAITEARERCMAAGKARGARKEPTR